MRLAALPLVVLFACAGTMRTPTVAARTDCGPATEPMTARHGTEVRSGPESNARVLSVLKADTAVCGSSIGAIFGFRRVTLPDGSIGFVAESSL
jgi:hypothetical protein